jgi:uncharacterized protein YheU (UPF0270 family)
VNLYEDFLRADTVSRVNRYVARSGVDYGEAWRRLRTRLTALTGYTAPKSAKNKIAAIHEAGHLELFHKLAGELR